MSGTLLGPEQAMRARDSEKFDYSDNFFGGRERCDTMKKTKRGSVGVPVPSHWLWVQSGDLSSQWRQRRTGRAEEKRIWAFVR